MALFHRYMLYLDIMWLKYSFSPTITRLGGVCIAHPIPLIVGAVMNTLLDHKMKVATLVLPVIQ